MPCANLNNVRVLVTRPVHQAAPLIRQLEQQGAKVTPFPVIEICDVASNAQLTQQLKHLLQYDLLIFISANAVHKALAWLQKTSTHIQPPVLAIGNATAKALKSYAIDILKTQTDAVNSEALLKHESLQGDNIKHKKVLIFRGQAGREVLADELRQRGAVVEYAQVYRRQKPSQAVQPLLAHWQNKGIDVVTLSSNEALQNLYDMLGEAGRDVLLTTAIIVPSLRCAELAQQLGFKAEIIQATSAADQATLSAIKHWQQQTAIS